MLNFRIVRIVIPALIAAFVVIKITMNISYWWLILIIFLGLVLITIGSFYMKWNFFLNALHKNSSIRENYIGITFDDGPDLEITPKVLDLLSKYDMKATFFCIGKNIRKHPQIVEKIIEQGHVVGNHSYSHSNYYGFLSTNKIKEDIKSNEQIIYETSERQTKFFRPPFGVTNPNIARAIADFDLITLGWSIRSFDTVAKDADKVFKNISSKIQKGDVILLHDNSALSLNVLEKLLKHCKKENLESVTLAKLFNIEAYA